MRTNQSVFWRLRIFSRHFFQRFGLCSLHLISLGLIKLCAESIGDLKGAYQGGISPTKYRKKMNHSVGQMPTPPHLTTISFDVYKTSKSTFCGNYSHVIELKNLQMTATSLQALSQARCGEPMVTCQLLHSEGMNCIVACTHVASLLKPVKYILWARIMNCLLSVLERQWTHAEIDESGLLEQLIH